MNNIIVKITSDESNYIERLFYEYNASLNIIAYLMSRDTTLECHLQKYLDSSESKYAELEIAKKSITDKYKPDSIDKFTYSFDFEENTIEYVEV